MSVPPPSPQINLYGKSCTPKSPKVAHKKRAVKMVRKEKNPVFNESNIFSYIKVYQLQSTGIMNYPEGGKYGCRKIRTSKTPYLDTFHAVSKIGSLELSSNYY